MWLATGVPEEARRTQYGVEGLRGLDRNAIAMLWYARCVASKIERGVFLDGFSPDLLAWTRSLFIRVVHHDV